MAPEQGDDPPVTSGAVVEPEPKNACIWKRSHSSIAQCSEIPG
jgi:hypothetical protein